MPTYPTGSHAENKSCDLDGLTSARLQESLYESRRDGDCAKNPVEEILAQLSPTNFKDTTGSEYFHLGDLKQTHGSSGNNLAGSAHTECDEHDSDQVQNAKSRKRKKPKMNSTSKELRSVQKRLTNLKDQLTTMASSAFEAHCRHIEHEERIDFLKKKLLDHQQWVRTVYCLMASSPLSEWKNSNYEVFKQHDEEVIDGSEESKSREECISVVDQWRQSTKLIESNKISFIHERVQEVAANCLQHGGNLINTFKCQRSEQNALLDAQSRGWNLFVVSSDDRRTLGFYCRRERSNIKAEHAAMKLWNITQKEELLRAFFPSIQETVAVYAVPRMAISRRIILLQAKLTTPKPLITIETVRERHSQQGDSAKQLSRWVLSLETLNDEYLRAYSFSRSMSECTLSATSSSPNAISPLSASSMRSGSRSSSCSGTSATAAEANTQYSTTSDAFQSVLLAAQFVESKKDDGTNLLVEIAGSIRLREDDGRVADVDSPPRSFVNKVKDPAAQSENCTIRDQLLRYLATILPIYEELHLASPHL